MIICNLNSFPQRRFQILVCPFQISLFIPLLYFVSICIQFVNRILHHYVLTIVVDCPDRLALRIQTGSIFGNMRATAFRHIDLVITFFVINMPIWFDNAFF